MRGRGCGLCPARSRGSEQDHEEACLKLTDPSHSLLLKEEKKSLPGPGGGGKDEKTQLKSPTPGEMCREPHVPFLNGRESQDTVGSGTKKVGREKHLQSLLQVSGSQTGGYLAIPGEVLDVIRPREGRPAAGGGGHYWHLAGTGQRRCSTPSVHREASFIEELRVSSALLPATFWNISKGPFRAQRRPHRPLLYPFPKSSQPKSHPTRQLGGMGGKGEKTILETTNEDGPSAHQQPPTPAREKSQAWAIFGQTGKRKAELKGRPLHPTCPAAKAGVLSLCTEVHAREQMSGPRSLGGWEEKQAGQAGGWAPTWPSLVLNQGLHLVHKVPGQLQDLSGVVSLGHL